VEALCLTRVRDARDNRLVTVDGENVTDSDSISHSTTDIKDATLDRNLNPEIIHSDADGDACLVHHFLRVSILLVALVRVDDDARDRKVFKAVVDDSAVGDDLSVRVDG